MKKTGLILMVLVVITGRAQQRLAMMDARSELAKFSPGNETLVSVRVINTQSVVAAVTATLREERTVSLALNDSGEEGDEFAGDGVWFIAFDVPYKQTPDSTTGISRRLMLMVIR
ncbi:MAG: hypothetical protein AMJ43_06900 [Coxiella sp. DG_40]|nr:MAG: hypothetical protein AMJ43_06900 [Coxiella sp. DG_40]